MRPVSFSLTENIEESIKTVHKFLTKTVKMEIKESDINIAHRLGPFRPRQNRPVIVRFNESQIFN
jgi:hypothetical protein